MVFGYILFFFFKYKIRDQYIDYFLPYIQNTLKIKIWWINFTLKKKMTFRCEFNVKCTYFSFSLLRNFLSEEKKIKSFTF